MGSDEVERKRWLGSIEQDLRAGALEVDELAAGDLAAVEAEVVGAGAVGEGVGVEDVGFAGGSRCGISR